MAEADHLAISASKLAFDETEARVLAPSAEDVRVNLPKVIAPNAKGADLCPRGKEVVDAQLICSRTHVADLRDHAGR
jgi:hypothetical protein